MNKNLVIIIILVMLFLLYKSIDNFVNISENFNSIYIRSPYNPNNVAVFVDDTPTIMDNYLGMYKNIYEYISNKKLPEKKKYIPDDTQKNATYVESFNRFYKKVNNTFNELFSGQCNYLYKYSLSSNSPPSNNGNIYLNNNVLIINPTDYNKIDGISSKLSNRTSITITDGEKTETYNTSNYKIDDNKDINVTLNPIPSFKLNVIYTLYPCTSEPSKSSESKETNTTSDSIYTDIILENNINISFTIFIISIIVVLIIMNWKFIYTSLSGLYSSSKSDKVNKDVYSGGKKYYIGGYDYRDYSE